MACGAVASRAVATPSAGVAGRPRLLFADLRMPTPSPAAGATAERQAGDGGGASMLDFAIFAVTFLLALVGAVLYLYPVTSHEGFGVRVRREYPGCPSAGSARGESHVAHPWSAFPVRMRSVVAGLWPWAGTAVLVPLDGFSEAAIKYLGCLWGTLAPSDPNPVCCHIREETPNFSCSPCICPVSTGGMGELSSSTQILFTCPIQRGNSQDSELVVKETSLKCIV